MKQKYIIGDIFMVDNQPRKVTWIGASYPRVEIDGVDVACKNSDLKPIALMVKGLLGIYIIIV